VVIVVVYQLVMVEQTLVAVAVAQEVQHLIVGMVVMEVQV
jgi:hypothetical protein